MSNASIYELFTQVIDDSIEEVRNAAPAPQPTSQPKPQPRPQPVSAPPPAGLPPGTPAHVAKEWEQLRQPQPAGKSRKRVQVSDSQLTLF